MKMKMKKKILFTLLISLLVVSSAVAQGVYVAEDTETSTSASDGAEVVLTFDNMEADTETTGGSLRLDDAKGAGDNYPVGEGLAILSVLAGGYAAAKKSKKIK
jgi:hypothetical protein